MLEQGQRERERVITGDDPVFLLRWLRHPTKVGAITPSGRALSEAMAAPIDWSKPGHVVELGAGMGSRLHAGCPESGAWFVLGAK